MLGWTLWAWMLLGWVGVSLGFAVLYHRIRAAQPKLPSALHGVLARFEAVLARDHPEVQFCGLIPGELTAVLRVRGQETPVPLRGVLRFIEAHPDALQSTVDQLVDEIVEVGLERPEDHPFEDVATDLLPQVRPLSWVKEQGAFGGSALLYRPLTGGLCVTYVVDSARCMTFVCRAHLQQWGQSLEQLHNLAVQNLRLRTGDVTPPGNGPMVFRTGDGFDAARMLLLDPERCEGLLVAAPDRDLLWAGTEDSADLAQLMAANGELNRSGGYPVSAHVLRMESGQLVELLGEQPRAEDPQ